MALSDLGVRAGDRVAVLAGNRPAWLFTDLGAQGIGAVTVGIYPTNPPEEVAYVLGHSGAVVVVCEDEEQTDKVLEVRDRCPDLRHIVVVDPTGLRDVDTGGALISFAALERTSEGDDPATFAAKVRELDPDAPAIIVYTSGTTGPPKGAMLSQRNLMTAARSGTQVFATSPRDEALSYLPLCHIAERLLSVVFPLASGYVVNFGGGIDHLASDLVEVQPTVFLGVPRVWEKLLAGVEIRIGDATRLKRLGVPALHADRSRHRRATHLGDLQPDRPPALPDRLGPAVPAVADEAGTPPGPTRPVRGGADRPGGPALLLGARDSGVRSLRTDREHGPGHRHP